MSKPEGVNHCYNRKPFRTSMVVQKGWEYSHRNNVWTRDPVMETVPNNNSRDCQYSVNTRDPKCGGCKWNQGTTP